mmetsp:Transcript_28949/g.85944  ORF Transcript_28949/g.85944 Transcript_28949/m.85944 type:complete len:498 (-) Transcript_28949:247-1740(-)
MDRGHVVRVGDEARVALVARVGAVALLAAEQRLHGRRLVGGAHRHLVDAAAPVVGKLDVVARPRVFRVSRLALVSLVFHRPLDRGHRNVSLAAVHAVGEALHLVPLRGATQVRRVATRLEARSQLLLSGLQLQALEPGAPVHGLETGGADSRDRSARRSRLLEEVGEGRRLGGGADLRFRGSPHGHPLEREAPAVGGAGLRGLGAEELPRGEVVRRARDKHAQVDVATVVREVHRLPVRHHEGQLPGATAHGHELVGEVATSGGGLRPSLEGVAELVREEVAVVGRLPSCIIARGVGAVVPHPISLRGRRRGEIRNHGRRPGLRVRLVLLGTEVRVPRGEAPGARDPHAAVRAPVHVRGLLQGQLSGVRILVELQEVGRTRPVLQMHDHVGLPIHVDHAREVRVVRDHLGVCCRPRGRVDPIDRSRPCALLHDDAEGVALVRVLGAPGLARLHNDLVVLLVVCAGQDRRVENLHLLRHQGLVLVRSARDAEAGEADA